ncbi:MAG: hypothetical protein IBJ11_01940 [Phycisphaerales bacterium]|nr:hypothetical protein [Phycisphaerales bacterium]
MSAGPSTPGPATFPCKACGARLEFTPGAESLSCPYCGASNPIPRSDAPIEELDYLGYLREIERTGEQLERTTIKCQACGAEPVIAPGVTSLSCPFCGSNIVAQSVCTRQIKPRSLLPFHLSAEQAARALADWVRSRWFAPGNLKSRWSREQPPQGMYTPHWTYDCNTSTAYTGERGEHYWVTVGSGNNRRRERRTRWYPASGRVRLHFDNVLVPATRSLPEPMVDQLVPWDLNQLVPYDDAYLAGFRAESYQIGLADGFTEARQRMEEPIRSAILRDIGGDEQRISSLRTAYADITFKHILLPIWISAYRYNNRIYRVLVNARTGEVVGERPYSWIKIALAVLTALLLVAAAAAIISRVR